MIGLSAWAAALLVFAAQVQEFQRPEPPPLRPGSAAIHGRVFDAISEKAVAGLEVRLIEVDPTIKITGPRQQRTATTRSNSLGEFSFTKVGSGSYGIMVTGRTHLPGCLGSTRQSAGPCPPVHLEDDQAQRDADIFVRPAAILRGRVVDHEGRPVSRAGVRIAAPGNSLSIAGGTLSDGEGRFEIGGLAPGQLMLTVETPGRNGEGLVRAYYPGVSQERDAQPIFIEVGDPVEVEVRMPRIVIGSINAHVSGPDGFQLGAYILRQPETKLRLSLSTVDDGAASIPNLRSGRYVIEARGTASGKPVAAFATIDVGESETQASMQLEETATITGRVIAERGGVPPLSGVSIAATWMLDGIEVDATGTDAASVAADGGFTFEGLFGTRIFKVTGLDAGWRVVSIRADRTDITASAFDIVPGSRTQLTITVARQ